ncbi:MAG: hypothetical protein K8F25_04825 [Fimbriimonadaceae bacterium]|nr:hypothetical protein [Alphaproteobacteria bacterium]
MTENRTTSALIEPTEERALLEAVRTAQVNMEKAIAEYVKARTRLEVRKAFSTDKLPRNLNLKYRTDVRTEAFVTSFIESQLSRGAKLGEIYDYVTASGKDVSKNYITTVLGRLKKDGKVERKQGGYWTMT